MAATVEIRVDEKGVKQAKQNLKDLGHAGKMTQMELKRLAQTKIFHTQNLAQLRKTGEELNRRKKQLRENSVEMKQLETRLKKLRQMYRDEANALKLNISETKQFIAQKKKIIAQIKQEVAALRQLKQAQRQSYAGAMGGKPQHRSPWGAMSPKQKAAYTDWEDKQIAKSNPKMSPQEMNRQTSFINSNFAKFSIIMSGIAATLFVFQQAVQWIRDFASVSMEAEASWAKIGADLSLSRRELEAIQTASKVAGFAGTSSIDKGTEAIQKYIDAGLSARDATNQFYADTEKHLKTYAKTATDDWGKLLGAFRELNLSIVNEFGPTVKFWVNALTAGMKKFVEITGENSTYKPHIEPPGYKASLARGASGAFYRYTDKKNTAAIKAGMAAIGPYTDHRQLRGLQNQNVWGQYGKAAATAFDKATSSPAQRRVRALEQQMAYALIGETDPARQAVIRDYFMTEIANAQHDFVATQNWNQVPHDVRRLMSMSSGAPKDMDYIHNGIRSAGLLRPYVQAGKTSKKKIAGAWYEAGGEYRDSWRDWGATSTGHSKATRRARSEMSTEQILKDILARRAITKKVANKTGIVNEGYAENQARIINDVRSEYERLTGDIIGGEAYVTEAMRDAYIERLSLARNWRGGAMEAMRSYQKMSEHTANQTKKVFADAFKGLEDTFVEFAKTGQLSWKSLMDSIYADLARLAVQKGITGPLANVLGQVMSNVASFHAGGRVGAYGGGSGRRVNPGIFLGAPRFHNGLASDEFPAILQRGEQVVPKNRTAGSKPEININMINKTGENIQAEQQGPAKMDNGKVSVDIVLKALDSRTVQRKVASIRY